MALTNARYKDSRLIINNRDYIADEAIPTDYHWTPSEASILLWLDANDLTTISQVGGVISQWNDKSGNGYHVSQGVEGFKPLLVGNAIQFDEVDDFLSVSTTALRRNEGMFFSVIDNRATISDINKSFISYNGGNNPDLAVNAWSNTESTGQVKFGNFLSDVSYKPSNIITIDKNVKNIVMGKSHVPSDVGYIRVNGTQSNSTSISVNNAMLGTEFSIGRQKANFPLRYFGGFIYEIIYSNTQTTDIVFKIEGYLAWKWGTVSLLPNDHLYKTRRPLI